jgi:hypothetical protein
MAKALTQIAGGGLVESKWQPRATTEQMGETGGAGEASNGPEKAISTVNLWLPTT